MRSKAHRLIIANGEWTNLKQIKLVVQEGKLDVETVNAQEAFKFGGKCCNLVERFRAGTCTAPSNKPKS